MSESKALEMELSALASDLAECKVEIREVSSEWSDNDGEMNVTVKYEVSNDTDQDWEYLEVRMQLLSAEGLVIEECYDTFEQTVAAGESEELEGQYWSLKAALLGKNPEKARIVLSVTACTNLREHLGEIKLPEDAFEVVPIESVKVDETLRLVSGSIWKTEPDDSKDCQLEVRMLVQNLTQKWLPQVKIEAKLNDKSGRELTDISAFEEVRPGAIVQISGTGYEKAKKFAGAIVDYGIAIYLPAAAGLTQYQGLSMAAASR